MNRWYPADPRAVRIAVGTDAAGIGSIPASAVEVAAAAAMATWNGVTCGLCDHPGGSGCSPVTCAPSPLGLRLVSSGVAPHTPWICPGCAPTAPNGNFIVAVTQPADWAWSKLSAAQTQILANKATGEIVDADILFNLVPHADGSPNLRFCQGDCAQQPGAYPLCIPLTHELGHVIGLNHSVVAHTTMAVSAGPSDLFKCQLAADDILGACTLYRSVCSGIPGEISRTVADCDAAAAAQVRDEDRSVPPSCRATGSGAAGGWFGICLASAIASRLGSGRARAKRT